MISESTCLNSSSRYVEDYVEVPAFILQSELCQQYLLYYISVELHRKYPQWLSNDKYDCRYTNVEYLNVSIHNGPYTAIKYKIGFGVGYKLPRIYYSENNER